MHQTSEHAFKRSAAPAAMSFLWAVILALVGAPILHNDLPLAAVCLGGCVAMLVNCWWSWKTPYARTTSSGLIIRPTIVSRSRSAQWSDVEHVQGARGNIIGLVVRSGVDVRIRLKSVDMAQRADLVSEIERSSGKRLRKAALEGDGRRSR